MSQLANALHQVVKRASNPNSLVYKVQLAQANKDLEQGRLGGSSEGVVALEAPKEEVKDGKAEPLRDGDEGGGVERGRVGGGEVGSGDVSEASKKPLDGWRYEGEGADGGR